MDHSIRAVANIANQLIIKIFIIHPFINNKTLPSTLNLLASVNFDISSATISEYAGVVALKLNNIGTVNGTVGKF